MLEPINKKTENDRDMHFGKLMASEIIVMLWMREDPLAHSIFLHLFTKTFILDKSLDTVVIKHAIFQN